ncbi:ribose ABC transport system, permease protein RbsC [Lachnospiraceae bacterium KM106-2]|nr:ribose ABC transport system, permease protein RbsC [Lachnospiraceae bacterium KM106-2]
MKDSGRSMGKRLVGILAIPVGVLMIILILCGAKGIRLFATEGNWIAFFQATATVMITTIVLSINLNSGRFDFSIGSISLLSSVISASICIRFGLATGPMLLISIIAGAVLGLCSGVVYVLVKLPPIIISLGITLLYEGAAFTVTNGYGVSFVANNELVSFPSVFNYIIVIVLCLAFAIVVFDHTKFGYDYKALLSGQKVAVETGIHEVKNAIICYTIAGGMMGIVGFLSATNTGTIQMALNFGSISIMFTAFLPMFIGGFIGRFCNEKIGYFIGALTMAFVSLAYARLNVHSSVQQIITALLLVGFLIYLNNEKVIKNIFGFRKRRAEKNYEV